MTIEEAYIILGLDFGANEDEINKSYKELVKLHHPDKGGDNSKMTELNTAKEIALSPDFQGFIDYIPKKAYPSNPIFQ